MDSDLVFGCEVCSSPAVSLPDPITEIGLVRCAACHAPISSWAEYKAGITRALGRSQSRFCADPLMTDADQVSSNGFSGTVWPASAGVQSLSN